MSVLKRCPTCGTYTMQGQCPACQTAAQDPSPPKFSPEDKYGAYRRRLKRLDEAKDPDRAEAAGNGAAGNEGTGTTDGEGAS